MGTPGLRSGVRAARPTTVLEHTLHYRIFQMRVARICGASLVRLASRTQQGSRHRNEIRASYFPAQKSRAKSLTVRGR